MKEWLDARRACFPWHLYRSYSYRTRTLMTTGKKNQAGIPLEQQQRRFHSHFQSTPKRPYRTHRLNSVFCSRYAVHRNFDKGEQGLRGITFPVANSLSSTEESKTRHCFLPCCEHQLALVLDPSLRKSQCDEITAIADKVHHRHDLLCSRTYNDISRDFVPHSTVLSPTSPRKIASLFATHRAANTSYIQGRVMEKEGARSISHKTTDDNTHRNHLTFEETGIG